MSMDFLDEKKTENLNKIVYFFYPNQNSNSLNN